MARVAAMQVSEVQVRSILTRAGGFLRSVSSHSLQPYRGCSFGASLCGAGCYVQAYPFVTRGRTWGSFLEARVNAAAVYRRSVARERSWARRTRGRFGVFLSSATDPFVPQEARFRLTRALLEEMVARPPDELVIQTHAPRVAGELDLYPGLAAVTDLRFHISVESDRERLPGLPPPAASVASRLAAAGELRRAGLRVVITVAPLLPIHRPGEFFRQVADVADGVVLDHFIAGDGTPDGRRTRATPLPAAMARIDPAALEHTYLWRMVEEAVAVMPGRVGVHVDGFAGRFLPA